MEKLVEPKFNVGDKIVNAPMKYMGGPGAKGTISKITDDKYIFTDGSCMSISSQDSWELVSDRFDPQTLKPFDKVLARHTYNPRCMWFADFIECKMGPKDIAPPTMGDTTCFYVIPYNEETAHLCGTSDDAPEYYRYWEDWNDELRESIYRK